MRRAGVHEHAEEISGVPAEVDRHARRIVGRADHVGDDRAQDLFVDREGRSQVAVVDVRVADEVFPTSEGPAMTSSAPPRVIGGPRESEDRAVQCIDVIVVHRRQFGTPDVAADSRQRLRTADTTQPVLDRPRHDPDARIQPGRCRLERLDDGRPNDVGRLRGHLVEECTPDSMSLRRRMDEEERQEPVLVATEGRDECDELSVLLCAQRAGRVGLQEVAQYRVDPIRLADLVVPQAIATVQVAERCIDDPLTRRDVRGSDRSDVHVAASSSASHEDRSIAPTRLARCRPSTT